MAHERYYNTGRLQEEETGMAAGEPEANLAMAEKRHEVQNK